MRASVAMGSLCGRCSLPSALRSSPSSVGVGVGIAIAVTVGVERGDIASRVREHLNNQ